MNDSKENRWIFRSLHDFSILNRREALKMFGSVGAVLLIGCSGDSASSNNGNPGTSCVVTPQLTEGPYFVDERLNRANITAGQPGLPLSLAINVFNASTQACSPISGVQIDLWHASGNGIYSDIPGLGADGQTFLRGYQLTNANGVASFQTMYPGWYTGRATHIHLKARLFNASGAQTLDATTQLFFDDNITDTVYSMNAPYNSRRARDTRNASDGIYGGRTSLLVNLNGSPTGGYTGAISVGIAA
jgi:protocatechuate 3,4-dioxygenase beta subunit